MKKILISCPLLLSSCFLFAQDKQAILKVLDDQHTARNNGDIDGFMQGYWKSDSWMFVGKSAPCTVGKVPLSVIKRATPDKAAMGKRTFTVLKVDLLDSTNAFMLGAWHLDREKDAPRGYFTLWFRKINSVWVIVVDHTS